MKHLLPLIILACVALGCVDPKRTSTNPGSSQTTDSYSPVLEVHQPNWVRSETGSYFYLDGEVRNISSEKLDGVKVLATFYDGGGNVVTTDTAYLELYNLMPGQTSPWKMMVPFNPAIKTNRLKYVQGFMEEELQVKSIERTQPPAKSKKK